MWGVGQGVWGEGCHGLCTARTVTLARPATAAACLHAGFGIQGQAGRMRYRQGKGLLDMIV